MYKLIFAVLAFGSICKAICQTTLDGDHVIAGDLHVGTSGTTGSLVVTGGTGSYASPGLTVTGDGGVVFSGSLGTSVMSVISSGPRLTWDPKKAAFRAGIVQYGNHETELGEDSVAFGAQSAAPGRNTFAASAGYATNWGAVAIADSQADGIFSVAGAGSTAVGACSVGLASGSAYGDSSFGAASGMANEKFSAALARGISNGYSSFSAVKGSALGQYSLALGYESVAAGSFTSTLGVSVVSDAFSAVVVGHYNTRRESQNSSEWIPNDELFIVGNGSGNPTDSPDVERSNAFEIYKNGNVRIPKRQGDILMGEFGD